MCEWGCSLGLWVVGWVLGIGGFCLGMGSLGLWWWWGLFRVWAGLGGFRMIDFGVEGVGFGIGCGEFWSVVLGFGWDRWGWRVG